MDGLAKDLRYAARTLRRSPGFALVAVLTIALGIGANTAIFSVVRGVLLSPLPYPRSDELVVLWGEMRNRGVLDFPHSPPDFRDYREQADLFRDLGAVFTFPVSLTGDGEPEQVIAGLVTPNFFRVLGVQPGLGRDFAEEDGAPQGPAAPGGAPGPLPNMVILGHALWQQRYGGDPSILGRTIQIGGVASEIVGVTPDGFELLMPPGSALASPVDLWVAARLDYANSPRNNVFLRVVGRLKERATLEQAQAQVDRIATALAADDQVKTTAGYAVRLEPLQKGVTADVRPTLVALFGMVAFVLLIACANVSNLLLVRATGREREMAVRAAMGGSRGRLARQTLVESGLIAGAGALVGLALAWVGVRLLLALHPANLPRLDAIRLDGWVLGFTAMAAVGAALLFGMVPSLQASRLELADALKDRGQAGGGPGRRLLRDAVVVGEVALSVVLLIGAGLMVRSFVALTRVSPGFEAEGLLTFTVPVPFGRYPQPIDRANLHDALQRALEAVPGVTSASAALPLPLDGQLFNGRYGTEEALTNPEAFRQATYRAVLPEYFETMGTPLLAGRPLTRADQSDSARVVVVDDKLARILWPGESAVGKRLLIRAVTPDPEWMDVVGVVEHQYHESLTSEGRETVFMTDRYVGGGANGWAVRTTGDPLALVPSLRAALRDVDPDLPMADVRPMADLVQRAMAPTRFALTLIALFGVVALALAVVGLYGVLSYTARQRTAEIGVRMAFGAAAGRILRLVVAEGLALAAVGVVGGVGAALGLTRVMRSLLVGVTPTDPLTFVAIGAGFLVVAAGACWIPARRATHVDPVVALRGE
jgi:predicted permease